jgi:hypothetical protein
MAISAAAFLGIAVGLQLLRESPFAVLFRAAPTVPTSTTARFDPRILF